MFIKTNSGTKGLWQNEKTTIKTTCILKDIFTIAGQWLDLKERNSHNIIPLMIICEKTWKLSCSPFCNARAILCSLYV